MRSRSIRGRGDRGEELLSRLSAAETWASYSGSKGSAAVLDEEDLRPIWNAFERRNLPALSAKGACAIGVNFAETQLQGAKFDGADLREANFSGADLRGASFRGAKLWHAVFDRADLRPLTLGANKSATVNLVDAQFQACAFDGSLQ